MIFHYVCCCIDNEFAWREDEEFGRQMLAGINPTRIRCIEVSTIRSPVRLQLLNFAYP